MSDNAPAQADGSAEPPAPPPAAGGLVSEDWLATITGLVILVLVLAGVITKGMVP
jgi:hypothetical protein